MAQNSPPGGGWAPGQAYPVPPAPYGHSYSSPSTVKVSSGCLWSSVYFDAGTDLAESQYFFFAHARSQEDGTGRVHDLTDTNMTDPGRVPGGATFSVTKVSWKVAAVSGATEVESLAQAYGRPAAEEIRAHGVLSWDFTQTHIQIGPLWRDEAEQLVVLPGNQRWRIIASFGKHAPKLDHDHVLRVCIEGRYKNHIEFS